MGMVEVDISMSVDGFITGPRLDEFPGLGEGGDVLHAWIDENDQRMVGEALAAAGAIVTSRTVYDDMDGWGEDGWYHMPVFVLTHRPHETVVRGPTTFTFVTGGVEQAITEARAAAGDKKVHVMGGATVIQQAFRAGLVDGLFVHVAPVLLGAGTSLFEHLGDRVPLEPTEVVVTKAATHLRFEVVK